MTDVPRNQIQNRGYRLLFQKVFPRPHQPSAGMKVRVIKSSSSVSEDVYQVILQILADARKLELQRDTRSL